MPELLSNGLNKIIFSISFFFSLGFLSRIFTIHRTALPPVPETLRHYLGDYCRELTSAQSYSQIRTGNLWFLSASCQPLSYASFNFPCYLKGKTATCNNMLKNGNSNVFDTFKFHTAGTNLYRAAGLGGRGVFRTLSFSC